MTKVMTKSSKINQRTTTQVNQEQFKTQENLEQVKEFNNQEEFKTQEESL